MIARTRNAIWKKAWLRSSAALEAQTIRPRQSVQVYDEGPSKAMVRTDRVFSPSVGKGHSARRVPAVFLLLLIWPGGARPQSEQRAALLPLAPGEIVRKLVEENEFRARELKYFCSQRYYHVEFHGMGLALAAQMHVQATYTSASGKSFRIIDESGSRILLDHVLKRLLVTEHEDSLRHEATLSPKNYTFHFMGSALESGQPLYIFSVEPKVKKKLLFRGKIWVDAKDYAVVKVEAQPAVNPSYWIKSTHIEELYAKFGEFWLPKENRSESRARFGGSAVLSIDYGTYSFEPAQGCGQ